MGGLRIAFMGTPDFSVHALQALLDAGHQVVAVYSQPPRPAGRGHKEQQTPVHAHAARLGIPVFTPKSLKSEAEQQAFRDLDLDVAVVAAYGLILPPAILQAPRWGCLNIHASLLPRWRGAAPIQRAILAGDPESGITIMQMDQGLDTGAMLLVERLPLDQNTTASQLHDALADMGARLIVRALADYPHLVPRPQPQDGVTYAAKLQKDEGKIDWTQSAEQIHRHIRALNPAPGVWCWLGQERLKLLQAQCVSEDCLPGHVPGQIPGQIPGEIPPGTALDDALTIACGQGALRLLRVQRAGKAPMNAADLLRGFAIPAGTCLG